MSSGLMKSIQIQSALALSAAAALMYEIVATSVLLFYVTESSYSIATVLSVFLGGLGVGSFLVYRFQDKIRHPERSFGILQGLVALYGIFFFRYIPQVAQQTPDSKLFLVSALMLLFPTILLGAMFPLASKILHRKHIDIAGLIYAADILGAVGGSLLAGFFIIPQYGYSATVFVAVALNIFAGVLVLIKPTKIMLLSLLSFFLLTGVGAFAAVEPLQSDDHWKTALARNGNVTIPSPYGEVAIHRDWLSINGRIQCSYTFPDTATEKTIAYTALSVTEKENPLFLNIGLGCAGTASVLAQDTQSHVDVAEINPVVIQVTNFYKNLSSIPNIRILEAEGFSFMRYHTNLYDSIVVDIEEPNVAHASALYTREAFQAASSVLTEHGTLLLWSYESDSESAYKYTDIIYYTLAEAFPYIYHQEDYFIASKVPEALEPYIPQTEKKLNTRDKNTLTQAYLEMGSL